MKKLFRSVFLLAAVILPVCLGMLIADKQTLSRDLIRLHVVAASDSEEDQNVKLLVRDAVTRQAESLLADAQTAKEAAAILEANLPLLTRAANDALAEAGSADLAAVTFEKEAFPVRHYETFSLPSGVYQSLRVHIGSAQGENWWCVVFPSLCINAVSGEQKDVAAASGFSHSLNGAITGKQPYTISFFFLDCLGKLENLFFS